MLPRRMLAPACKRALCTSRGLSTAPRPALTPPLCQRDTPSLVPPLQRQARRLPPTASAQAFGLTHTRIRGLHSAQPLHDSQRKQPDEEDIHDVSSTAAALAYGSLRKQGTIRNLRLQPKPKPRPKPSTKSKSSSDDAWTREALAQREGSPVTLGPTPAPPGSSPTASGADSPSPASFEVSSQPSPASASTSAAPASDTPDSPPQPPPDRAEDLLKLRSLEQADKGSPRSSATSASHDPSSVFSEPQMIIDLPPPSKKPESTTASSSSSGSGSGSGSSAKGNASANVNVNPKASPSESPSATGANEAAPPRSPSTPDSGKGPGDGWAEYLREPHQGLTPIAHMIDTREFARRLADSGWAGVGPGDKQQQRDRVATILAEGVEEMLVERLNQTRRDHISSVDVEYQSYVFRLALNEVKTELEVRARNDGASLRSMTQDLQREVDRLSQRAREDVDSMQHTIQVAMNEAKTEVKGQQNDQEQTVQDLKHKLTIVVSTLKTGLEHSLKWDLSRRAFLLLFGQICFFFTVFKLFSLSSKKDKGKDKDTQPPGVASLPNTTGRPQSAEDIGLVPHYDNQGALSTA